MYLSQLSILQTQAPFYINIIENIILGKVVDKDKLNIDSAIIEAIDVAKENKNFFTIDNNYYFLVSTLTAKLKNRLIEIDNYSFTNQFYYEILEALK